MYPAFSPHFPDLKPMDFAMFDHLKDHSFKLQELDELQKETTRRCHNIDLRNNFCFLAICTFLLFFEKNWIDSRDEVCRVATWLCPVARFFPLK
jgi:hypothetical protein